MAGKKAAKTASVNNAIAFAQKTVNSLEKLPHSEDLERGIVAARTALGLYYNNLNDFFKAKEAIDPVIDLAVKHDLKTRMARMYNILGMHHGAVQGEHEKGTEYLKQAIKLSEEVSDLLGFTHGNFWSGCLLSQMCQFDQAAQCFEKALGMSVAANSLWGISITKSNWAFFAYWHQGNIDIAYETSGEAVALAEESTDIFSKSWAYLAYGHSCYGKGLLEKGLEYFSKGADYCEKIAALTTNSVIQWGLATIHFAKGDYEASAYCFEQALSLGENVRLYACYLNNLRIGLAMAKVMNNDKDFNLELLRDYANEVKRELHEGLTYKYMAQILLNIDKDHMPEAENWISKAIEADTRNRMMFYLGQDYALYAELFKRRGDKSKAKENLNRAIDIFKECNADGWVNKYQEELASFA